MPKAPIPQPEPQIGGAPVSDMDSAGVPTNKSTDTQVGNPTDLDLSELRALYKKVPRNNRGWVLFKSSTEGRQLLAAIAALHRRGVSLMTVATAIGHSYQSVCIAMQEINQAQKPKRSRRQRFLKPTQSDVQSHKGPEYRISLEWIARRIIAYERAHPDVKIEFKARLRK